MDKKKLSAAYAKLQNILDIATYLNSRGNVAERIIWLEKEINIFKYGKSHKRCEPSLYSCIKEVIEEKLKEEE